MLRTAGALLLIHYSTIITGESFRYPLFDRLAPHSGRRMHRVRSSRTGSYRVYHISSLLETDQISAFRVGFSVRAAILE
jgi:hypothetical protein